MPDPTNPDQDPIKGANPNLQTSQLDEKGNPAPPAPTNKPPVAEPTEAEAKAAAVAKEAADKAAADKAAADANANDDKELNTAVWGNTGSENGDAVLTLLQNSGVTTDEAKALMFDALQAGDVTKIDRAALEAKVGKVKAGLIITGAKAFVQEQQDNANTIVKSLHETVGGKENWDKVAAWAKVHVPEDKRGVLVDMINEGGVKATIAAKELKSLYESADDNSSLVKSEVITQGGNPGAPRHPPMSAAEYITATEKANKTYFGNPPEDVRRALLSARQAGKKLGK